MKNFINKGETYDVELELGVNGVIKILYFVRHAAGWVHEVINLCFNLFYLIVVLRRSCTYVCIGLF